MITSFSELDLSKRYSYKDYVNWNFKERVELIFGRIFKMTPAPRTQHQYIQNKIVASFNNHFKNEECSIFSAPFDVRLPESDSTTSEILNVVQPDICVICDKRKIDKDGCLGAPDLIVEIISPSTRNKDLHEKFDLYQKSGVSEYRIVHPVDLTIIINTLNSEGKYVTSRPFVSNDMLDSKLMQGIKIELKNKFSGVSEEEGVYDHEIVRI